MRTALKSLLTAALIGSLVVGGSALSASAASDSVNDKSGDVVVEGGYKKSKAPDIAKLTIKYLKKPRYTDAPSVDDVDVFVKATLAKEVSDSIDPDVFLEFKVDPAGARYALIRGALVEGMTGYSDIYKKVGDGAWTNTGCETIATYYQTDVNHMGAYGWEIPSKCLTDDGSRPARLRASIAIGDGADTEKNSYDDTKKTGWVKRG